MRLVSVIFALILCISTFTGCKTINEVGVNIKYPSTENGIAKHKGNGPPPHAPAHGYRHKHKDGIELEYNSRLGVYCAVKMPSVYFYNNLYMKSTDGNWKVAANFDGPWRSEAKGEVPKKLKKKNKDKNKKT